MRDYTKEFLHKYIGFIVYISEKRNLKVLGICIGGIIAKTNILGV